MLSSGEQTYAQIPKALSKRDERRILGLIRDKNPRQLKWAFYLWSENEGRSKHASGSV